MDHMVWTLPVLVVVIIVIVIVAVILTRRKRRNKPEVVKPATYGGPIRVTHNGRDMKIIQKEDGTFEMVEEKKEK